MSPNEPDLAASSPLPDPQEPRGAASQPSPGTAPPSLGELQAEQQQQQSQTQADLTSTWQHQDQQGSDRGPGQPPVEHRTPLPEQAREIVRLFQCPCCSVPYKDAVTLPCGRSICKTCLPETHARISITYPALPNRSQAFRCPFDECNKEHVLGDCGVDVILGKMVQIMQDEIERAKADALELKLSTQIVIKDPLEAAGIASLVRVVNGGRLAATWTLAAEGGLLFEAEATYRESPSSPPREDLTNLETESLSRVQEALRGEMDCQICYALLYDPLTTGCGHTFCRPCLHRVLDHSRNCPVCRQELSINPLLRHGSCPPNKNIKRIMDMFWKDELVARGETAAAELAMRLQDLEPLFICTLAFPMMPIILHIFEPRYRLMIRRALEGDRTFGMVLPRRRRQSGDRCFHGLGTLLRIVRSEVYPDGRSLIQAVGLSRFRVLQHREFDGYTVGRLDRIDDVSLEEEEAMEAAEVGAGIQAAGDNHDEDRGIHTQDADNDGDAAHVHDDSSRPGIPPRPMRVADLDRMTTQSLIQYATGFVARMRAQSVPWLADPMLRLYGECPDDPAVFPWWFVSMLPVKDVEKYRLLRTLRVRDRLKICGAWIIEMETAPW
ncbi:LON peptidase N-terminal domain and RING finger protein 1 [Tolypocladium capitatum]|uniref:LON peptidase N-terminal domain and RING finger protein 1 n=1 Tax=Tolypocladium capitatum TaxID=45235 RepID=A0A2K3QE50_9HYPO|nr:LON peptidase N-terminal domain and RING finger protein 1 [Tolypocladium capitatum]